MERKDEKVHQSWLIQRFEDVVADYRTKMNTCGNRYVIVSSHHVMVEHGKGLNDTDFFMRLAGSTHVVEFESLMEAQYNLDGYLVDGNNEPIVTNPMKAYDFYAEEIKAYEEVLETLKNLKQAV